jgi:hypothetical protein
MSSSRLRVLWVAALLVNAAVGLAVGAADSQSSFRSGSVVPFGLLAVAHLVASVLLSRGLIAPSRWWGCSSGAQALQGLAWLALALVSARWPSHAGVGWALFVVPLLVIAVGIRQERQARAGTVAT